MMLIKFTIWSVQRSFREHVLVVALMGCVLVSSDNMSEAGTLSTNNYM